MKNFSGVCQAAGADKPLRVFFIWITNIVTLSFPLKAKKKKPASRGLLRFPLSGNLLEDYSINIVFRFGLSRF